MGSSGPDVVASLILTISVLFNSSPNSPPFPPVIHKLSTPISSPYENALPVINLVDNSGLPIFAISRKILLNNEY